MAIVFSVRGTQLTPYYSRGVSSYTTFKQSASSGNASVVADAGAIGGSAIQVTNTRSELIYTGLTNWVSNKVFSLSATIIPGWTGAPAATTYLPSVGDDNTYFVCACTMRITTTGKITYYVGGSNGVSVAAGTTASTFSFTSGTRTEIVITWTGNSGAGQVKIWQDGVEMESIAANASSSWDNLQTPVIRGLGNATQATTAYNYKLNELVIWDEVITPSAGRTDFYSVSNLNGDTMPTAAQTQHGVTVGLETGTYRGYDLWEEVPVERVDTGFEYLADGVTLTGDSDDPNPADVKLGVVYDNGTKTGTYDGSDRWTDPGEVNVKIGTAYKANSTTNNKTGTYTGADRWDTPDPATVLNGVTFMEDSVSKTGTLKTFVTLLV